MSHALWAKASEVPKHRGRVSTPELVFLKGRRVGPRCTCEQCIQLGSGEQRYTVVLHNQNASLESIIGAWPPWDPSEGDGSLTGQVTHHLPLHNRGWGLVISRIQTVPLLYFR